MKQIKDFIFTYYWLIIIVLVSCAFCLPFIEYYPSGHDTYFHAATINSIAQTIKNGNFIYPRIIPLVANDFGYATEIFYGPLSHTFAAWILGLMNLIHPTSVWTVMKIVHFISIFFSGLFMYYFVNKVIKNKNIALASSVIYMTFPYKLCEIFVRDAFAESLAFVFLPLIFWGVYELLYESNYKSFYKLFVIGMSGMILTHNITAIFTCIMLALYLFLNFKKVFKKEVVIKFLISGMFIFGITAIYTLPVIEQKLLGTINIFASGQSSASFVASYALHPSQLLPIIGARSFDGIQFNFLLISLIMLILSTFMILKDYKKNKNLIVYGILGCLALFCTTKLFPWQKVSGIFLYIQFPWRLLVFVGFFLAIISGYCIKSIKPKKGQRILAIIVCLSLLTTSGLALNKERLLRDEEFNKITVQYFGLGAINDYLPVKTVKHIDYFNKRSQNVEVLQGRGKITNVVRQTPYIEFEVNQKANEISTIELPLLYYKGYDMVSIDKTNIKMYENSKGFVEVKAKGKQKVVVNYVGTELMKISLYLSSVTLIIFIIFAFKEKKNAREKE